tara:strand:- start:525 stop:842 length:318 start_codon:yes stop_codon:yes gene_type:complete
MNKKTKTLDTLVVDIYKKISVLSAGKPIKITDKELDAFGNDMKEALKHWAVPLKRDNSLTNGLRMSNIGKPDRQLWYDLNSKHKKKETMSQACILNFFTATCLKF